MDRLLNFLLTGNICKKLGILAGFIIGLCILLLGFFQTLFLAACMVAGGYLGWRMDNGDRFFESFRNIFRKNE